MIKGERNHWDGNFGRGIFNHASAIIIILFDHFVDAYARFDIDSLSITIKDLLINKDLPVSISRQYWDDK